MAITTLPNTMPGQIAGPSGDFSKQPDRDALRAVALRLEAVFLSEMLKSAGVEGMSGAFSGGAGEAQTASFLRDAQAKEIAKTGGIGLSEAIFTSLVARTDGT